MTIEARKIEPSPLVSNPSPFERAFESYLDAERSKAVVQTRQDALKTLAEQGWEPKVKGAMRVKADEIRQKYEAMSEEDQAVYLADLEENHPELLQTVRDSLDDDDVICEMECSMIDKETQPLLDAYNVAGTAINNAEEDILK